MAGVGATCLSRARAGWAAAGGLASPGQWRQAHTAGWMCRAVSLGWGLAGCHWYSSVLLGCLPPQRPLPPELPHTVSVSGLELSCPGKVDSEVMTLNARQLDSNFKKLHSLRVEMKEKLPSKT